MAAGLRAAEPGSDRQCRCFAAPTRRLRRSGRRDVPGAPPRYAVQRPFTGDRRAMLEYLESNWDQPDEGIWEVRGPRQHFTHSKVMAWVAFDRAVKAVSSLASEGPVERWRRAARPHPRRSLSQRLRSGAQQLRAGLRIEGFGRQPAAACRWSGFCQSIDPRVIGTLAAIERRLVFDGLVFRYRHQRRRRTDCRLARVPLLPAACGMPTI